VCVNEDEDGEDCCMLLFELGNSGRGGITVRRLIYWSSSSSWSSSG